MYTTSLFSAFKIISTKISIADKSHNLVWNWSGFPKWPTLWFFSAGSGLLTVKGRVYLSGFNTIQPKVSKRQNALFHFATNALNKIIYDTVAFLFIYRIKWCFLVLYSLRSVIFISHLDTRMYCLRSARRRLAGRLSSTLLAALVIQFLI